ncbi:ABC transporter permease [Phytoactinopolyspora halotolerans]|uniref:ABC transporter permease n=1 Tax=Phytoactinopolyspora halotolerans TaxID=1981512 RepID=A0A6L9SAL5_9ACTN|nr:ABC transporter permease [Phytoactinopolyspora halotolerans]NEE02405.1 ABC transporter permease [Phytoactinopolyspora halotolerans]
MRHWLRSFALLLKWNMLRVRTELPTFLAIQTLISAGIVVGFSLLIPEIDAEAALYLTSGAMTVSLITVGMVVAPQIVAQRKEKGLLDYQRSMPVSRLAMMAADAVIWVVVALPGLAVTLLVAVVRFDLELSISPWLLPAVLLVSAGAAGVGYCIAYVVRPVLVGLVTNLVIIVALMFAPINYPAERLPDWAAAVHEWLPFQYMAQAVRETIDAPDTGVAMLPFVIITAWTVLGLGVTSRVMTRRA